MHKNKKALSEIIGYVLLIVSAIVISALVFQWAKSYIPKELPSCPEDVSVFVQTYSCLYSSSTKQTTLTLNLKNTGSWNIDGFYIKATNTSKQELATIDLTKYLLTTPYGFIISKNSILPSDSLWKPGDIIPAAGTFSFSIPFKIYSLEIIPAKKVEQGKTEIFSACSKSAIKQEVSC